MIKSKISTIFFDAGGVLFTTHTRRNERIRSILIAKGFDKKLIEVALLKGDDFWNEFYRTKQWLNNWKEEEKCWNQYYEVITNEIQKVAPYSLRQQLLYQTHYTIHCVLFDEVKEVLDILYGRYRLGVISNAFPSMDWVFDSLDIRKYFDSITISAFVDSYKPQKEIYESALNSLSVQPKECLFIDNHIENVEAAEKLGFKGLYLDRKANDLKIIYNMINDIKII